MTYVTVVNGRRLEGAELKAWQKRHKAKVRGKLEDMLATRRPPGCETDDTYLSNFGTLLDQFDGDERALEVHLEHCRDNGFVPDMNSVYLPTLAQKSGDPRAHVKSRADAVAYAEEIGVSLEINGREVVKHREPESDPWDKKKSLGDDLVRESAAAVLESDPKLAGKPQELREAVIDKHAF